MKTFKEYHSLETAYTIMNKNSKNGDKINEVKPSITSAMNIA